MQIWWILSLALVAVSFSGAHAQLAVGPGGLSTPPINLISVFKFLRDIWVAYMYPTPEPQVKNEDVELIPVEEKEVVAEVEGDDAEALQQRISVMGFDTNGNIVEKFDSDCLDDGTGQCARIDGEPSDALVEDKTGTTQVVLGKWPILYISLISVLFWLFVIVATPYIITGESIGRREDEFSSNSIVDDQDVLLLLSWMLAEVSGDVSCLERVVCLTAPKSSRYISVSSMIFNVASYLRSWVPYSPRFEDLLHRLEYVTHSQDCHDYFCPTAPDL